MRFVAFNDTGQLPVGADALFGYSEKDSMFFSQAWIENLVEHTDQENQGVFLACVLEDDTVLAILPLVKTSGNSYGALRHRYTSLYTLLLADDDRNEVVSCLVQGLRALRIDSLLLEPVADDDDRVTGLQRCLASAGYDCHRYFRFYNWAVKVGGQSFESYMAGRPARLRNTIARKKRKLQRETGYATRIHSGSEVPAAMNDYHAVYRSSWKAHEQYPGLLAGMVDGFSRQGCSRLAVLYIGGKPAAAQLWFVLHRKASIFRLAYDEHWKQYSPGSILTSVMMEYVIETDRVEEIDFLTGNEAYKQDWMSERRERWALSCVRNDKPETRMGALIETLKRSMKA